MNTSVELNWGRRDGQRCARSCGDITDTITAHGVSVGDTGGRKREKGWLKGPNVNQLCGRHACGVEGVDGALDHLDFNRTTLI